MKKPLPDYLYLHECFLYNEKTGVLTWKVRPANHFKTSRAYNSWNARYSGNSVGSLYENGYFYVGINATVYVAHRIIWKMITGYDPSNLIDHIDENKTNNIFSNLREATCSENQRNCGSYKCNTSGLKGVSYHKLTGLWQASIRANKKQNYLGLFHTPEQAYEAYKGAAIFHHKEFANFGTTNHQPTKPQ